MKALVASTNPTKVAATRNALRRYYPDAIVEGISVETDSPEQPVGDETLTGARARAQAARGIGGADLYVGIEGGLMRFGDAYLMGDAVVILGSDGSEGIGMTPCYPLPADVVEQAISGRRLSEIMDERHGTEDVGAKNGSIGLYTDDAITRTTLLEPGIIAALIPHRHPREFLEPTN